MSLSALPEWKQLLLERKRREEEERERREREEEERMASMPAWKRGIIQRRRAKQDEEREREKDGGQNSPDVLGISEDVVTEQTDSKLTHHLQTEVQKQISKKETISPIQQNPFIRSENSFRRDNRGKEVIRDGENECGRERNRETEIWRGRDREMWFEKTGNKSEGRERDRSTGRETRDVEISKSQFSQVVGLRTIQANNIIIIERDKHGKEKPDRMNKEVEEEEKRMRMDLREFLACGGSVTEIRASEVLIIKPSVIDGKRETEIAGMPERGSGEERLEREGIWRSMRLTSRTVMQRAEIFPNHKDKATQECSGRVSLLLSKFGEHPKPPMRSKSTDCFNRPGKNRDRYSTGDLFVPEDQSTETSPTSRGVPKRSFSFSDRVVSQQENREGKTDVKKMERTYSDRRVKTRVTGADPSENQSRFTRRWGRPKHDEPMLEKRQKERRVENKNDFTCGDTEEQASSVDGEEGFTRVSVKNQEGVTFARRVPIKQDGRESSSGIEIKRVREENEKESKQREVMESQTLIEVKTEAKTESDQDEETVGASTQSHGASIPSSDNGTIDFSAGICCKCVNTPFEDPSCPSKAYAGQTCQEKALSDGELKRAGDVFPDKISSEMSTQDQKEHQNFPKRATEEISLTSQQSFTQGLSKLCTQEGVAIPRTVFYGVDILAERRASLPVGDGQLERRGSWKAGRPLTRVESLKERIRQQEKEMQKGREADKEGGNREQEENTLQSVRPFDVTQDASMAKSSPQLPLPVSQSLLQKSDSTEREVGEISIRDAFESENTERGTERHVEIACRAQDETKEREDELLEEEYLPPSLSPSPTLSDSLDAMSRIYNLKTVGSRTAVCISERSADLPPHSGPQGKYNPIRQVPSPDVLPETVKLWNHGRDGEKPETIESTGVQMVQRLQLREPEAGCGSQNDRKVQTRMENSRIKEPEVQEAKRPDILRETQASTSPRFPKAQQKVPPKQTSFTINARNSESTTKPPEPCTPSPSTTPSPPLFSIRSASGGPGKRGTTITITPRRPAGISTPSSVPTGTPKAAPPANIPTPAPSNTRETGKKRFPTAEEIEVIGGYQNLERSCLAKSKAATKAVKVKVCFDEVQLERVCEYPSEDCVLASLPCSPHPGPEDGAREEEEDEEDENTGRVRVLKVDESCKRVSK
ncbi:trichohyalin [Pimephales promelas]|uniref:trichohyalin n=1 Tax=Pimephales promelas TaxID=90988 RepID=UPI0019558BA0|nr:trichohyalin [Pimephales promelas]